MNELNETNEATKVTETAKKKSKILRLIVTLILAVLVIGIGIEELERNMIINIFANYPVGGKENISAEMKAELAEAPDVEGLTKKVQRVNISDEGKDAVYVEKVTYIYNKDNPYGGVAGKIAGNYEDNVTVDGKDTGAVVFEPKVVEVLRNKALAAIPDGGRKVEIVVPMDLSKMNETDEIDISLALCNKVSKDVLVVNTNKDLNLIDVLSNENQFVTSGNEVNLTFESSGNSFAINNLAYLRSDNLMMSNWDKVINNNNIGDLVYYYIPREDIPVGFNKKTYLGDGFGLKTNQLIMVCANNSITSLEIGDLFTLDGKVVAMSQNPSASAK